MSRYPFQNPTSLASVTPNDSATFVPSVLYIGGAGNIRFTSAENSGTVTFLNVDAGQWLPCVVNQVWSGSTTCSGIIRAW